MVDGPVGEIKTLVGPAVARMPIRWGVTASVTIGAVADPRKAKFAPPMVDNTIVTCGMKAFGGRAMQRELNVLALLKGKERYVFVFDDRSRDALIDTLRDQAADPRLSLSWFDAAVLTEKARQQTAPTPEDSAAAPRLE